MLSKHPLIITFNLVYGNILVIHSPFQGHRTYWSMKVDVTCCVRFVARQRLRVHADSSSIKFVGLRAGTVNSLFPSGYIIIAKHVCHERRSL